ELLVALQQAVAEDGDRDVDRGDQVAGGAEGELAAGQGLVDEGGVVQAGGGGQVAGVDQRGHRGLGGGEDRVGDHHRELHGGGAGVALAEVRVADRQGHAVVVHDQAVADGLQERDAGRAGRQRQENADALVGLAQLIGGDQDGDVGAGGVLGDGQGAV